MYAPPAPAATPAPTRKLIAALLMFISGQLLKPSLSKACASKRSELAPIFAHLGRRAAAAFEDLSSILNREGGRSAKRT
jgi:hypothetical protein